MPTEKEEIMKLIWRLVAIFGSILGLYLVVFAGSIFAQYKDLAGKLDKEVFVEYKKENRSEHEQIRNKLEQFGNDVNDLKVDVNGISIKLEGVNKNIEDIKDLLEKK